MYLRKVDGPRSVTLPDGRILTRADLPSPKTRRWVASRKEVVVQAVLSGLLSQEAAQEMYALSVDEYMEWENAVKMHGRDALKTTTLQRYRQP